MSKYGEGQMYWTEIRCKGSLKILGFTNIHRFKMLFWLFLTSTQSSYYHPTQEKQAPHFPGDDWVGWSKWPFPTIREPCTGMDHADWQKLRLAGASVEQFSCSTFSQTYSSKKTPSLPHSLAQVSWLLATRRWSLRRPRWLHQSPRMPRPSLPNLAFPRRKGMLPHQPWSPRHVPAFTNI